MREGLIGFGHAVHIFLLLHGSAARIGRVDQLIRQPVDHGLAGALPRNSFRCSFLTLLPYFFLAPTSAPPSAAWPHTSTAPACDFRLPRHPAFRARCDSARPANP